MLGGLNACPIILFPGCPLCNHTIGMCGRHGTSMCGAVKGLYTVLGQMAHVGLGAGTTQDTQAFSARLGARDHSVTSTKPHIGAQR